MLGVASVVRSSLPVLCRRARRGLVPPAVAAVQRRFLNLHEYQAQQIFQKRLAHHLFILNCTAILNWVKLIPVK